MAAADDVELRRGTLHNETGTTRILTLTSASEPVLLPIGGADAHPAFDRLFVEFERLPELDALVCTRRPRCGGDLRAVLVHRLVTDGAAADLDGFGT